MYRNAINDDCNPFLTANYMHRLEEHYVQYIDVIAFSLFKYICGFAKGGSGRCVRLSMNVHGLIPNIIEYDEIQKIWK